MSAYATMHPSEDWAETFSHYLHIRDTLQTAAEYRLQVGGPDAVARVKPTTDLRAVLKGLLRDHLRVDERALARIVFPDSIGVTPTAGLVG